MTELDRLRTENQALRRQGFALRNVANLAVSLLENGATRDEVIRHLEDGFAEVTSPVKDEAGQAS